MREAADAAAAYKSGEWYVSGEGVLLMYIRRTNFRSERRDNFVRPVGPMNASIKEHFVAKLDEVKDDNTGVSGKVSQKFRVVYTVVDAGKSA